MILDLSVDIINLLLVLLLCIVLIMIIFKTKKGLDTVYKYYFASGVTLLLAILLSLNKYMELVPFKIEMIIFDLSRFLAMLFFVLGSLNFLRIIDKTGQ